MPNFAELTKEELVEMLNFFWGYLKEEADIPKYKKLILFQLLSPATQRKKQIFGKIEDEDINSEI